MAKQLIHQPDHFLGLQLAHHIVVIVKGLGVVLARAKISTVHFGVHDLLPTIEFLYNLTRKLVCPTSNAPTASKRVKVSSLTSSPWFNSVECIRQLAARAAVNIEL
jgi:hypothetical protein